MTHRPIGITVISVLFCVGGVVTLLSTLVQIDSLGTLQESGIAVPFFLVTNIVLPIASLAAAYGLWNQIPWAWRLGAALAALNLFSQLLIIGTWGTPKSIAHTVPILWKLVIPLAVLLYLLRAPIVMAFGWGKEAVAARRIEALGAGLLMAGALVFSLGPLTSA